MKLRCSKLPLGFKCPGSIRGNVDTETLVEMSYEGGALGSAVHEVLAAMVEHPTGEYPDPRPIALKHGVESEETSRLVTYGVHAWKAIAQYYPNPVSEQDLVYEGEGFVLTGHLDVVSIGDGWANFADWKSGYRQPDYYAQIMGYARLIFAQDPSFATVKGSLVWLRDWSQETVLITREDADAWERELIAQVVNWNGTYRAGEHCQYCPRFTSCPARQALVRSAVEEIGLMSPGGIVPADAMPAIVQMYREGKLSIVKGLLGQIDEMIRSYIQAVGPIDLGNGRELAMVPENRDTILPLQAWPIISERLTNEELAPCIKIGKTALLDAIGEKAGKGKGKAKAALMEELTEAKAVTQSTIYKLKERKIDPTKEG
jgi:hypothetical protein